MKKNKKKKILVITGSRAEYGLLKSTIDTINESNKLHLLLLVTGMHTLKKYGYTINEIKKDNISINAIVRINENDSMVSSLAEEINGINKFCERNHPDMIIVLGDRDESFAGAIVGSHLGIAVGHIHGGDFTGTIVDGLVRQAITKLSHLHFTSCRTSYARVRKLQENSNNIFLVGAPGLDNLNKQLFLSRKILAKKLKLDSARPWLLFLMHPAPFDLTSLKKQVNNALAAICELTAYEKIIIYPNADTGSDVFIKAIDANKSNNTFHIFPSLPRQDYLSLLKEVKFMVGNSSSGIIESTYFKLPTINIGDRQKNRERGKNVINCDYEIKNIVKAISLASSPAFQKKAERAANPYGSGRAAKKIVKILEKISEKKLILEKTYN